MKQTNIGVYNFWWISYRITDRTIKYHTRFKAEIFALTLKILKKSMLFLTRHKKSQKYGLIKDDPSKTADYTTILKENKMGSYHWYHRILPPLSHDIR